jgi:hypothetical protein
MKIKGEFDTRNVCIDGKYLNPRDSQNISWDEFCAILCAHLPT